MFSGLVFLGLGGVFVTGRVNASDLDAQWLWPMPLILGGLFIFLAAFRSEPRPAGEVAAVDEATEPLSDIDADEATQDEVRADIDADEATQGEVRADEATAVDDTEGVDQMDTQEPPD